MRRRRFILAALAAPVAQAAPADVVEKFNAWQGGKQCVCRPDEAYSAYLQWRRDWGPALAADGSELFGTGFVSGQGS